MTTFGFVQEPAVHAEGLKEVKDVIMKLNKHLDGKQFLVGDHLSIADLAVFLSAFPAMELALDAGFRKACPHFAAWYERITKMPETIQVAGHIKLPAKGLKPVAK